MTNTVRGLRLDIRDEVMARAATIEQGGPVGNGRLVAEQVMVDIARRAELGRERYGTYLKTHNGRDALVDAYQEALDLACYLKQAIMERDPA